jgi:hypothetical protein
VSGKSGSITWRRGFGFPRKNVDEGGKAWPTGGWKDIRRKTTDTGMYKILSNMFGTGLYTVAKCTAEPPPCVRLSC